MQVSFSCALAVALTCAMWALGQGRRVSPDMNELGSGKILYVMRVSSKTQKQHLPAIFDTWAEGLPKESMLIVGDAHSASEDPKVYSAMHCPDDHEQGLSCKTGYALAMAAKMIGNHDWVTVLDDDHYVNTTNLERKLASENASQLQAFGHPKCGPASCDGAFLGFCGGSTYTMSRAALNALVNPLGSLADADAQHEDYSRTVSQMFVQEAVQAFGGQKHMFSDVTTSCLMKRRGILFHEFPGLYGWRVSPTHSLSEAEKKQTPQKLEALYRQAIHTIAPLPLTFHYIRAQEMYLIRDEFARPRPQDHTDYNYAEQLAQYIAEGHNRFAAA